MRNDEEHLIQCAIIKWAIGMERAWPELEFLHAIPNGGARDARTGARLKCEGVKPGVWDMFLPFPRRRWMDDIFFYVCGLYIEVKVPGGHGKKRGVLSPDQKRFGTFIQDWYHKNVVYSADEGIDAICSYLGRKRL